MWKKYKPYIVSVSIALAVGGLSAFVTRDSMNIYEKIKTPPLSPPGWLFPVVWGILYVLMGISSAMIYLRGKETKKSTLPALKLYAYQLVVNFFWSVLFFNKQAFLLSFVWLGLLWVLVLLMIRKFFELDRLSAQLQIPYFLWITFAGYLNFMIWMLNK